jgi:hypothetical protein
MQRHKTNALVFEASPLPTAERRRMRESFERIAERAPRKPSMIHSVRHHGAQYDAATVVCVLETHAMIDRKTELTEAERSVARKATIIAGLAHLAEQKLALLAMLDAVPLEEAAMDAQAHDFAEDLTEKRHDLNPSPATAADWLTASLLAVSAEEVKCAAIRPRALEAYGPRNPRTAA